MAYLKYNANLTHTNANDPGTTTGDYIRIKTTFSHTIYVNSVEDLSPLPSTECPRIRCPEALIYLRFNISR